MKVYILKEYDMEGLSEILGVFDTLEKAQSYKNNPKDWTSDFNAKRWWDSMGKIHRSISEWEIQ